MAITFADMTAAELKAEIARRGREIEAKQRVLLIYASRVEEIDAELEAIGCLPETDR